MTFDPNTPTPEELDLLNEELVRDGELPATAEQVAELRQQMPDEEEK